MNPLLDCPLNLPTKKAVKLMSVCDLPAFVVNSKGVVLATSNIDEAVLAPKTRISSLLLRPFSALGSLEAGQMLDIKIKLGEEQTALVARFTFFYLFVLSMDTARATKSIMEESVVKNGTAVPMPVSDSLSMPSLPAGGRREQKVKRKAKPSNKYPMHKAPLSETLEKSDSRDENALFDPAKALEAVCVIAKDEFAKWGIKLKTNIAPAHYFSNVNELDYFSALADLLMVGADTIKGTKLVVEGTLQVDRYVASVVLKGWTPTANWEEILSNYAVDLKEQAKKQQWSLSMAERADGANCLSLAIRLTQKRSFSFLRYGDKDPVLHTAFKQLSDYKGKN